MSFQGTQWAPGPRPPLYGASVGGWSYTAGDFEESEGGLFLAAPRLYVSPASPTSGSPGTGRSFINSARIDSASIASGVLSATSDTTATIWNSGTRSCGGIVRDTQYALRSSERLFIIARTNIANAANNLETAALLAYETGVDSTYVRAGVRFDGADYNADCRLSGSGGDQSNGVDIGAATTAWNAIELRATGYSAAWYALSSSDTLPTSGWAKLESNTHTWSAGNLITAGVMVLSKGAQVTANQYGLGLWSVPDEAFGTEVWPGVALRPVWAPSADLFATSGPVASIQFSIPGTQALTDAQIRSALQKAARWRSTDITARAKRGGAPSGAYAALDAITQEAGGGDDLYLDLKFTSDGVTPVGIDRIFL